VKERDKRRRDTFGVLSAAACGEFKEAPRSDDELNSIILIICFFFSRGASFSSSSSFPYCLSLFCAMPFACLPHNAPDSIHTHSTGSIAGCAVSCCCHDRQAFFGEGKGATPRLLQKCEGKQPQEAPVVLHPSPGMLQHAEYACTALEKAPVLLAGFPCGLCQGRVFPVSHATAFLRCRRPAACWQVF